MQDIVFDTSILLLFFNNEQGYKKIQKLLNLASVKKVKIIISEISLMEVYYKFIRILGEDLAEKKLTQVFELPLELIPIDQMILKFVAHFKAKGGISVADAIVAATAKVKNVPLLTKDPEFLRLKDEIKVELL